MRMQEKWILAFVVVFLGIAGALPATGQECAGLTDGHRSLVLRPEPALEGPVCREPATQTPALPAAVAIDLEPRPTEYCNCDVDADCKAICGDAGGHCGIYMACPIPPYKHVGTCFCGRQAAGSV